VCVEVLDVDVVSFLCLFMDRANSARQQIVAGKRSWAECSVAECLICMGPFFHPAKGRVPICAGAVGSFTWSGLWGTYFWITPVGKLIAVQMLQLARAVSKSPAPSAS
jgi:hypothetical protein